MGKKKKTYVKPEMKIVEVKTEGVIAASGGEMIIDPDPETLCSHNDIFSNPNSCKDDHTKCSYTNTVENCKFNIEGAPYKTCYKDHGIYHIDYEVADGKFHIYPCNCNSKKH